MKNAEQNLKLSVIVSETATPKQRELADWLVTALAELDVQAHLEQNSPDKESSSKEHHEQSVADEGKPKTPLPDEEDSSSAQEEPSKVGEEDTADKEDWDDDDLWPLEPDDEKESVKERTRGFLTGLFTAWLVTGAGVLILRLARTGLRWLAGLTDIPFDVLTGLCILTGLALLLRRRTRQFVIRIADWFDFDF